jgi:hypothetical protein
VADDSPAADQEARMPRPRRHTGRHRAPGRHRRPRGAGHPLRAALTPRLSVGNGLKALGLAASALGLATAYAVPSMPGLQLATETTTTHAPRQVRAATVASPERSAQFGVIGFSARAEDSRPAGAGTLRSERRQDAVSRGIRRTGLHRELGLTQPGLVVLNAIRDHFPQIHSFGGYRPGDMDHGSGNAVDTMVSSRSQGDAVAAYVMAHAAELDVKYVIWRQRIWYPSSGTWRGMADRGSVTANHYDHVHVSVR